VRNKVRGKETTGAVRSRNEVTTHEHQKTLDKGLFYETSSLVAKRSVSARSSMSRRARLATKELVKTNQILRYIY
jgi:hypothetical protein